MRQPEAVQGPASANVSDLLTSKLAAPALVEHTVSRGRLLDRLSQGVQTRVTLVSAGPGWGKTVLAASWVASKSGPSPVAWLSLDSFDNDPSLFWSYFVAAVRGAAPSPAGGLDSLLIRSPVGDALLQKIIVTLGTLPGPLVVVLDDFGEIRSPDVLDGIAELLRHDLPLRLVLLTRSDPALHLQKLRLDGQLTEIREVDLAFTETEARELINRSGARMPAEVTRRLLERTEGWVAALRLALFVPVSAHLENIDALAGEQSVAEYLLEEVLSDIPKHQRAFLLRTSVADRMCAQLADVLCEQIGSQRQLEGLAQANAFVVAVGNRREWFRYHPLLAELLRHRLKLESPELAARMHRWAAEWFAARGDSLEAVRQAVRAQDWQLAGELVVRVAAIRMVSSQRQAFGALLDEIPAGEFVRSPELRACAAARMFLARDYDGFSRQITHARAMLGSRDADDRLPVEVFLTAADMVMARVTGDVPALLAASEKLLATATDYSRIAQAAARQYEAPALNNTAVGLVWSSRQTEAEPYLRGALSAVTDSGAELVRVNSLGYLGLVELGRGRLSQASAAAGEGLRIAASFGWTELAQAIACNLVEAEVCLERAETVDAQRYLAAGLAAQQNDPEQLPYVALQATQARLLLLDEALELAAATLSKLEDQVAGAELPLLLQRGLGVVGAEIAVARGRPVDALRRLTPLLGTDSPPFDEALVVVARAWFDLGRTADAESALTQLDRGTNPVVAVRAAVLDALLADHRRHDHLAIESLDRALALAEPDRISRPFMSPSHDRLRALLRHRLNLGPASAFTRDIAAKLDSSTQAAAPLRLVVPLTDRERVVLSHMDSLHTNEQIAEQLFVSVNTIKAHAASIYRKLSVGNRREAVARGRDYGLL